MTKQPPQNHRDHPESAGVTFTFPLEPGKSISHPQQAMLPLPTHSCYPVSNDLKLFPLSGLLLLVLEIILKISILPDSWPLPELTPLTLFPQERALPQDSPSLLLPGSCDAAAPACSLRFAALPSSFSKTHCTPSSSCNCQFRETHH